MVSRQLLSGSWSKCHDLPTKPAKEVAQHVPCIPIVPIAIGEVWDYIEAAGPESRVEQAFEMSSEGRHEEAIAVLDELIDSNPDLAVAYNNRAHSKEQPGQNEEAISDYDEADRLEPDDVEVLYKRSGAKVELGQYEEAVAAYNRVIQLEPGHGLATSAGAIQRQAWVKLKRSLSNLAKRSG